MPRSLISISSASKHPRRPPSMARKTAFSSNADQPYKPCMVAPTPPPPAVAAQPRRKAALGTRKWLVVSENGAPHLAEFGKHAIMRRTGLPGRDLRILDPMLSYPSTILGRERAIVVKLEHVKAIIKATEALVLNPHDRTVEDFADELLRRVSNLYLAAPQQAAEGSDNENGTMIKGLWNSPASTSSPPGKNVPQDMIKNAKEDGLQDVSESSNAMGPKALPFEFRVLEVCLESACRCLENETVALEKEAYPALDELTSKISTLNLERVRQIKSRLVGLSGRAQKVRDELEHLLDDDMDMAEMYLTDKLVDERFEVSSSKRDNSDNELDSDDERSEDYRSKNKSMSGSVTDFKPNIEDLEMLLEAYFVQTEGTLNKLSTMREYVDDTEDYINIMLDDKQNQLLQMGVMLSTATMILSAGIVVVGVFGMNIKIDIFNDVVYSRFWETAAGTVAGCLVLFLISVLWGKRRGLLA